MAAGLGMLAGGGSYLLAFVSAVLTIIALRVPHKWLRRKRPAMAGLDEELDREE